MPAQRDRVLVTGMTGALGPAVLAALLERDYRVRVMVRRPQAQLEGRVEVVTGDVTDPPSLARAVEGVDIVIHLAALLHVVNPDPSMQRVYQAVNVDGTRALADAARRAGVRRFLLASTTAVYGPTSQAVTESASPAPDSWYAASKLAAETGLRACQRDGEFDTVVLRLGAVYGPRIKGNYHRLLQALAAGRFVPIGAGRHCRSLVFEDDAGAAFALAAHHAAAPGGVFNVTDGTPHQLREIIAAMCTALGRPLPRLALPAAPVRLAATLATAACGLVGRRPPTGVASVIKYLEPSVVDASRLARVLGYRAEVDLESGWRRTVAGLRLAGALPMEPSA